MLFPATVLPVRAQATAPPLLWGDAAHFTAVQLPDLGVAITYDLDPAEAVVQRRHVLKEASRLGYLIGGAHLPFSGLGHVRAEGQQYQWVPLHFICQAGRQTDVGE